MENESHRLEIPENIPLRWELWRGFGWAELGKSALIVGAACAAMWLYIHCSDSPLRILTAIVVVVASGIIASGLFTRQNTHLSMYDYIKYAVQFQRTQHRYHDIKIEEVVFIEEKS